MRAGREEYLSALKSVYFNQIPLKEGNYEARREEYGIGPDPFVLHAEQIATQSLGRTHLSVYEFGAGYGGNARALAKMGHHVLATDVSVPVMRELNEDMAKEGVQLTAYPSNLLAMLNDDSRRRGLDAEFPPNVGFERFPGNFNLIVGIRVLHNLSIEHARLWLDLIKRRTTPLGVNVIQVLRVDESAGSTASEFFYWRDELDKVYEGWKILEHVEDRKYRSHIIAQKPLLRS